VAKQAGARMTEVPIRFVDRVEGESKMSGAIVVEALALVSWWGMRRLIGSAPGRRLGAVGVPGPPE